MKYRLLNQDEWGRLNELVDSTYIPSANSAAAAIAEDDDGNIQGVLFMQRAIHVEPLILFDPKVSFKKLYEQLYNGVADNKGLRLYSFANMDVMVEMARQAGMKKTDFVVMEGEVK